MNAISLHSTTGFRAQPASGSWRSWGPDKHPVAVPDELLKGQQAHLQDRTAIVFGLGAVGGRSWLLLAQQGVGKLIGVDPDCYGPDSWRTQPAPPGDTGRPKAWALGEEAHAIHPAGSVLTARGLAQDVPLSLLRQADAILVAGDNLELLIHAGNAAAALAKPLIQGAVHGETYTALVRGWDLRDPLQAACPGCGLKQAEWANLTSRYGCDPQTARAHGGQPTRTAPVFCATAGALLAAETVKWLEANERYALCGEELAYCLLTHKVWRTRLPRNPQCRCPHQRWRLEDVVADSAQVTLAQLAKQLGNPAGFQVRAEVPWISFAVCPGCDRKNPVHRFARLGEFVATCPCGRPLPAAPLGMRSIVPAADLKTSLDKSLTSLGLAAGAAVGFSGDDSWTFFILPGDPVNPDFIQERAS